MNKSLEKEYKKQLNNLEKNDLIQWARARYTDTFFAPILPYQFEDPMDELYQAIQLLNSDTENNYEPLLVKLEETLVQLFIEESSNHYIHPWIIYKFLFMFINCPPKGRSRLVLVNHLRVVFAQKKWKNIKVGARNLNDEALSLLTRIASNNIEVDGSHSINKFLLHLIERDQRPRISVITLGFFRRNGDPESFFEALNISYRFFNIDELHVLIDELLIYYKNDTLLSYQYLAGWLANKVLSAKKSEKLKQLLHNQRLFDFFSKRLEANFEIAKTNGTEENCFLISILIFLGLDSKPSLLSPTIAKMFIENEKYRDTKEKLIQFADQLLDLQYDDDYDMVKEISNFAKTFPNNYQYHKIHLAGLFSLWRVMSGDTTDFTLSNSDHFYIDYEEGELILGNDNHDLLNKTYSQPELRTKEVVIANRSILLPNKWWNEVMDSVNC